MAWNGLSVLAVVPARGGSKSIPRKNLAKIGGKSLIAWTAAAAAALPWLDATVLSTDDPIIAEEGRTHGLTVPNLRPAELATDTAKAVDAWRHAWLSSENHWKRPFDLSILLQPTTPFRTSAEIEATVRAMVNGNHKAATTISRVPGHYTPQKTLVLDGGGVLHFFHPEGAQHSNRQSIPAYYSRNGLCYAVRRQTLLEEGTIVEDDCVGVIIKRPLANIDDPIDLEFAEFLYQKGLAFGLPSPAEAI